MGCSRNILHKIVKNNSKYVDWLQTAQEMTQLTAWSTLNNIVSTID